MRRVQAWSVSLAVVALSACGSGGGDLGAGGSGGSGNTDGSTGSSLLTSGSTSSGGPCDVTACGDACGEILDGCGSTLECGECQVLPDQGGQAPTCGGAGANRCGPGECSPKTCEALGAACGLISDGCSKVLDCGGCEVGATCGANNQCVGGSSSQAQSSSSGCTPEPQCTAATTCQSVPDNCGGTVQCGCGGCAGNVCDGSNCGCDTTFGDDAELGQFADEIRCIAGKCIVNGKVCGGANGPCDGVHPTNFRAAESATRGQMAKIVSRAANYTDAVSGQTFQDVPPSHPFYKWIERLYKHGVVAGTPCGTGCLKYAPEDPIKRGQAAKMIAIALGVPLANASFQDVPPENVFYQFVGALQAAGYVSGKSSCDTSACSGTCFCPDDALRRDQASHIIYQAISCPTFCPDPDSL